MDAGGVHQSTQALLEELAFAAEGGFLEEPVTEENPIVSGPKAVAVNRLIEDFSQLVDNPLMSDFVIRTKSKNIYAHRLVFTVRFPDILTCVSSENDAKEKPVLNWSYFSASAVIRVLRFIYSASYEHDESDARHVYRIARLHRMNGLLELLPHQYDSDSVTSDEDVDDDAQKRNVPIASTSKTSRKRSTFLVEVPEISHSFLPEPFSDGSQEKVETGENKETKESDREDVNLPPNYPQEDISIIEDTIKSPLKSPKIRLLEEITPAGLNCSQNVNHRSGKSITSAIDMEISNNITGRVVPLSPDMFEETLSDSDEEEPKSPDDVIDLTQETDSERKSEDRSASPFGGSCEMDDRSIEKSDTDVSMADCSLILSPSNQLLKNSTDCFLKNSVLEKSVASYSPTNPSFVEDLVPSRNCSPSEVENVFPDFPIGLAVPSSGAKSPEMEEPRRSINKGVFDEFGEFPDELDSIFPHASDMEPSPLRTVGQQALASRIDSAGDITPVPRLAKKRKMDVTPLPDYQSMETPLLKVRRAFIDFGVIFIILLFVCIFSKNW